MGRYREDRRVGYGGFVDDGLTLDIHGLLQSFNLLPGKHVTGTLRWVTEYGVATAGYEASLLNSRRAWLRLSYTIADRANGKLGHQDYRIRLTTTRTHLGGLRWWFRCPVTQLRTAKLYLTSTGDRFLSRRAYGTSRSVRRGLLVHLCDHITGRCIGGQNLADRGDPRTGAAASNPPASRRIYAEWLGRPAATVRGLIPQGSC